MDYPKSVPNVGLVGGKFVDENTATGQVGSLIPATWGSAVTDEILNVIMGGGYVPDETEDGQLLKAIKQIIADNIPPEKVRSTLAEYGITDAYTKAVLDKARAVADIDKLQINGTYIAVQATAGDKPTPTGIGSLIHVERGSSNNRWQIYNPTGEQRLLFRTTSTTGVWTAQAEMMLSTHNASQPEVDAGADDTKFVTSKKLAARLASTMPPGFRTGLKMTNTAAGSALLSVSPGRAKSADGLYDLIVPAALTGGIYVDGVWAAGGVNQRKLDAGVRASNTWYHAFVIRKASDGTVDLLFSLSPTAPTMPAGYVGFRRIGSVRTGADGVFIPFYQVQNRFYWNVPIVDVAVTLAASATTTYVVSAPTGVPAIAMLNYVTQGANSLVLITSPFGETQIPTPTNRVGYGAFSSANPEGGAGYLEVGTNAASQVVCTANSGFSVTLDINTLGWIDEL